MNDRLLLSLGLVLVVVSSGCIHETLLGGDLSFTASEAGVTDDSLSQSGYEHNSTSEMVVRRNYSVAGQTANVVVTNKVSNYEKSVELGVLGSGQAAVYVAFSTPQVDVLGRTFNPVGEMSDRELAEMIVGQYSGIEGLESAGSTTVTVLGKETRVSKFRTSAVFMGQRTVDVNLHITRVRDGDDYVVGVAIYPSALEATEEDSALEMFRGLEH